MFTKAEKSWILYDVANSAYSLIITTALLPIFFKAYSCYGIPEYQSTARWGYVNAAASMLVAVAAPLLGVMADRRKHKKGFFAGFFLLGVIATALLGVGGRGEWLTTSLFYILSIIGFSCGNLFYDAFLVDVTTHERSDLVSTAGYAWGYIGSIFPMFAALALIYGGGDRTLMTKAAFVLTAVWWMVFTLPLLRNVRQRYCAPPENPLRKLLATFRQIRARREVFLFLLAYFLYEDGVGTVIKMAVPYGRDLGLSAELLIGIVILVQIVAFPCALLYGRLARRFSAGAMIMTGIGIYVFITFLAFLLPFVSGLLLRQVLFWTVAMLVATSQGGIQALSRSYFSRIIPPENAAEFFGFYNILGKFAVVLGPLLVALVTGLCANSSYGILSIVLLFLGGGFMLGKALRAKPV